MRALPQPDLLAWRGVDRSLPVHGTGHQSPSRFPSGPPVRGPRWRDRDCRRIHGPAGRGRKWRDGIHQAIEAKEEVEVTVPTGQAARITIQDLFLRYRHLAGMTGTAITSAREFRKIYETRVVRIPTNRPVKRQRLPITCLWNTAIRNGMRLSRKCVRLPRQGTSRVDRHAVDRQVARPVPIAARSRNPAQRAQRQRNRQRSGYRRAGRATRSRSPWPPTWPAVARISNWAMALADLGGLHVICTEMHDAARIDRQLYGRCGRQGDPGDFRQYLSLDDEIIRSGLGPKSRQG